MEAIYSSPETRIGDGLLKGFVAANLGFYLRDRGLTRRAFADKVGVKEPAVSKWLSGDQLPRDQYWPKILEVLRVQMADLTSDPLRPTAKVKVTIPEKDKEPIVRFLRRQANELGYDLTKLPEN